MQTHIQQAYTQLMASIKQFIVTVNCFRLCKLYVYKRRFPLGALFLRTPFCLFVFVCLGKAPTKLSRQYLPFATLRGVQI